MLVQPLFRWGGFLKKVKMEILCFPAILLLGVCLNEIKSVGQRDICSCMLLCSFTIAKIWEQTVY
jgi:hypothetical protein